MITECGNGGVTNTSVIDMRYFFISFRRDYSYHRVYIFFVMG